MLSSITDLNFAYTSSSSHTFKIICCKTCSVICREHTQLHMMTRQLNCHIKGIYIYIYIYIYKGVQDLRLIGKPFKLGYVSQNSSVLCCMVLRTSQMQCGTLTKADKSFSLLILLLSTSIYLMILFNTL